MEAVGKEAAVPSRPLISTEQFRKLQSHAEAATVKIEALKDGTAFFVSYKVEEEICKGLMTNHHVVNFDNRLDHPIRNDAIESCSPFSPLSVRLSSKTLMPTKLLLDQASISYAFSCSFLDVTLFEFTAATILHFEAKGVEYLELDSTTSVSIGELVYAYQHPGEELSFCDGNVVSTPTPWACYDVSTRPGSSGSSLLRRTQTSSNEHTYQLVAIHHSAGQTDKYNCGTAIGAIMKAVTTDRATALNLNGPIEFPLKQNIMPTNEQLIQLLFAVSVNGAKDLHPPIYRIEQFVKPNDYGAPHFYVLMCGDDIEITVNPRLYSDRFTLLRLLDNRYKVFPWRIFSVDKFKAFHKLAVVFKQNADDRFLKTLENQLRIINQNNLAEYHCPAVESKSVTTIDNLKWCLMSKDGPKNLARALCEMIHADVLIALLKQYECNKCTEVELLETATGVLEECLQRSTAATKLHQTELPQRSKQKQRPRWKVLDKQDEWVKTVNQTLNKRQTRGCDPRSSAFSAQSSSVQTVKLGPQTPDADRCIILIGGSFPTASLEFYHPMRNFDDIAQIGSMSQLAVRKNLRTSGCYLSDKQQIVIREDDNYPPMLYGLLDGSVQELLYPYRNSDGSFLPVTDSTTVSLNGSVCISCGGWQKNERQLGKQGYLFDSSSDRWIWNRIEEDLSCGICFAASVALDSSFYLIGGVVMNERDEEIPSEKMYRYSLSEAEWHDAPQMPEAVYKHSAAVLSPTQFLVGGGKGKDGKSSSKCWLFSTTEKDPWRQVGNLNTAREDFAIVNFNGEVYALGGYIGNGVYAPLKSVEMYDRRTETWKTVKSLKEPRELFVGVAV